MSSFKSILQKYREESISERDKGYKFERLMQKFLKHAPLYDFESVELWSEFPYKSQFGGKDTGIDIVAKTSSGQWWAVQCKCYKEDARIDKPTIDTFLSTSGKSFKDDNNNRLNFAYRLWIDTTEKGFNAEAENVIKNQNPPVGRLGLFDLENENINWEKIEKAHVKVCEKYKAKEHQVKAIDETHSYFKKFDRGKLIMACGTGKTFTSLKIAEKETNKNGIVLFLVPSIALLGQTLREWQFQKECNIYPVCVCSDSGVSKTKDDISSDSLVDLAYPASTDIKSVTAQLHKFEELQKENGGNIVIFSTYQSIEIVHKLQKKENFEFDLIICDEAHRTTGVKLSGEDESSFIKVHNNDFLKSKRRLYMTATPRLYSEAAQNKAKEADAFLCSMDDAEIYGKEIYRIGFGEAVDLGLLSDYKVIVLTMDECQINSKLKETIDESEIKTDDALKIIGCINALHKKSLSDKEIFENIDPEPMHSAVAFCQNIAVSKETAKYFNLIRDAYLEKNIEADHVDGKMGAQERDRKLQWLKTSKQNNECRILHNVRCLSEGIDVPSLDAVLFLSAKNSQIDVVQSVGRVMRTAAGKKYGYIIIPVVVPQNAEPEKILDSDDRFKVVWTVLNALRAHDDRFNAVINKIELNKSLPERIRVVKVDIGGHGTDDDWNSGANRKIAEQLELKFTAFHGLLYAKMVQKCGSKTYWENWAKDVAKIAEHHINQITEIVKTDSKAKEEFEFYLDGLHRNINPEVSESEAIEMLAQHIITQPVFDAIFENYSFAQNNSVSKSLQGIINVLNKKTLQDAQLAQFYDSVRERAKGIDNAEAKQKIILELYEKFFKTAFPKMVEKLGIVYTPVEIVDFIIYSVEAILNKEFGRSMSDENVHILDPFTGTGTFITRLLQSGIIKNGDLQRKYTNEIHANEIVLLAYYIASINIENVFHYLQEQKQKIIEFPSQSGYLQVAEPPVKWIVEAESYKAFPGICLTDTFQLGENENNKGFLNDFFPQNSEQVQKQQKTPLRIIIGNPPYSIGQKSANDNAQNQGYPKLEKRIAETYVADSEANLNKAAYDTYIKAFRWASDRLDPQNGGIIAFVSNGAWLDSNGLDGFRKCLEKEFSSIYVYNLRGNQRTSGELSRKEGGKIFGSGSRTPVTITILVRRGEGG